MQKLIERYKRMRKSMIFEKKYDQSYAFVGLGSHALQNIYPVLDYLHVPLKYIVVRSDKSVRMAQRFYTDCEVSVNLDKVLGDKLIKGVFICATPQSHYGLVHQALSAGKHVFVEKPPCVSTTELKNLIDTQNKFNVEVFVGLQRRYSPAFSMLKRKLKNVNHYIYRYVAGAFPEGDALFELFIHPIDTANFLFGEFSVKSCLRNKNTYLLNVRHENGIIGNIELSADYSWKESFEYLSVNTDAGIFVLDGLDSLVLKQKMKTIANIPIEKIIPHTSQHINLFSRNTFIPNIQNNDLFIHGFHNELQSFVEFCESGNTRLNKSGLDEIRNTYNSLDNINGF